MRWYSPRDWIEMSVSHDLSKASHDHPTASHDDLTASHDDSTHDHLNASPDHLHSEDNSTSPHHKDSIIDSTNDVNISTTDDVTNNSTTDNVTNNSKMSGWDENWAELEESSTISLKVITCSYQL